MTRKTELLAPAGSFSVMKACIAAGADAVYMGLPRFSARAYAENQDEEGFEEAIRYAHLRGRKLYLTVNTLMKERELYEELPQVIAPLYEAGLDGVIVQDLGEMHLLHSLFPSLPIHASTQCAVVGPGAVDALKKLGVVRVVPARELSLTEIRRLADTGIEVECFIHGALCYCYSGKCLFSSLAGGRSGNRGRCAQPCRMEYRFENAAGQVLSDPASPYLLSLKDLNTLEKLPALLAAGVCSLKIEGRMKSAEYASGVTSIYRKYLDLLENGTLNAGNYRVDPLDQKRLFDLFNRQGFTDGYLTRQNGADMVTLKKPSFRAHDDEWIRSLKTRFIDREAKLSVTGSFSVRRGSPVSLTFDADTGDRTVHITYKAEDVIPQEAKNRALTEEDCRKQFEKTGDTPFSCTSMTGTPEEGLFLPVGQMNAVRRNALELLEKAVHEAYVRQDALFDPVDGPSVLQRIGDGLKKIRHASFKAPGYAEDEPSGTPAGSPLKPGIAVCVLTDGQFNAALRSEAVRIDLPFSAFPASQFGRLVDACHLAGKQVLLKFPAVFRSRAEQKASKDAEFLKNAGFDACSVSDFEALSFVKRICPDLPVIADETLYAFNSLSIKVLRALGLSRVSVPYELNAREILETGFEGQEMTVYGRVPMMVSAGCLKKTTGHCDGKPSTEILIDRKGNRMPVYADCSICMNTIYNSVPTSLSGLSGEIGAMKPSVLRISLLDENEAEAAGILSRFAEEFLHGKTQEPETGHFTRGHFKRGVE